MKSLLGMTAGFVCVPVEGVDKYYIKSNLINSFHSSPDGNTFLDVQGIGEIEVQMPISEFIKLLRLSVTPHNILHHIFKLNKLDMYSSYYGVNRKAQEVKKKRPRKNKSNNPPPSVSKAQINTTGE